MKSCSLLIGVLMGIVGGVKAATLFGSDKVFRTRSISNCTTKEDKSVKGYFIGSPSPLIPSNKWVVNGAVVFHEPIRSRLDLAIDAFRCNPQTKLDCEAYPRFMVPDFCEKAAAKDTFYDGFIKAITPPLECPIKKGTYTLNNATLALDIVKAMPLQGYRWRAQVRLFEEKSEKAALCGDVVLTIEEAKQKRRPRKN